MGHRQRVIASCVSAACVEPRGAVGGTLYGNRCLTSGSGPRATHLEKCVLMWSAETLRLTVSEAGPRRMQPCNSPCSTRTSHVTGDVSGWMPSVGQAIARHGNAGAFVGLCRSGTPQPSDARHCCGQPERRGLRPVPNSLITRGHDQMAGVFLAFSWSHSACDIGRLRQTNPFTPKLFRWLTQSPDGPVRYAHLQIRPGTALHMAMPCPALLCKALHSPAMHSLVPYIQ